MVYPAGGAPQEGEGQPQQHGFWLESQRAPEEEGQAIPSQRGLLTLVGPHACGGGGGLTGPVESCGPVLVPGVSCLGTLLWALYTLLGRVAPQQKGMVKGPVGHERSWGGLFLGESTKPSGGGDALFTALASWSPQTTRDSRGILLPPLGFPSGPCTRP